MGPTVKKNRDLHRIVHAFKRLPKQVMLATLATPSVVLGQTTPAIVTPYVEPPNREAATLDWNTAVALNRRHVNPGDEIAVVVNKSEGIASIAGRLAALVDPSLANLDFGTRQQLALRLNLQSPRPGDRLTFTASTLHQALSEILRGSRDVSDFSAPSTAPAAGLPLLNSAELSHSTPYRSTSSPKFWSLAIGVNKYQNVNNLHAATHDANGVDSIFQVINANVESERVVINDEKATRATIVEQLNRIAENAREGDRVMVYFSGHGKPGTLLTNEWNSAGESGGIHSSDISAFLQKCNAQEIFVIVDACYSGSMLEAQLPAPDANKTVVFFLASESDTPSYESDRLGGGIFTNYFVHGLGGLADSNGDARVSIDELKAYLATNVQSYSSYLQQPVIGGSYDSNLVVRWFK